MNRLVRLCVIGLTAITVLSCGKPANQFAAGDKVRVKLTRTEGWVWLRERPFKDEVYFLKVPGNGGVMYPPDQRDWPSSPPFYQTWHVEGPYCYTDLEKMP